MVRPLLLLGLLIGAQSLISLPARALVDFAPARRDFICGRLARDVAVIDFDTDGNLDLACVRFTQIGVVTLLRGDGAGEFTFFADIPAGTGSTSILTADINEDEIADLVTAGFVDGPDGTIGLHFGDGKGNFDYVPLPFPGHNPFHVNAGDLDGDTHLDLVAGGSGDLDGQVHILNGDGKGAFTPGLALPGGVPQHTAVGDVDGDGDLDLAVADNTDDVLIYRNDGAGGFPVPGRVLTVGREPVWIDIRTLGDPARPFLAVALSTEQTVEVFQWNPETEEHNRIATLDAPLSPIALAFLDPIFNHDPARPGGVIARMPGLAVVSQTSSQLRLWRTIDHAPVTLPAQDSPTSVRIADFNRDGLPDYALPGFNVESVSIYYGGGEELALTAPSVVADSLPIHILPVAMDKDPRADFAVVRRQARLITAYLGRPGNTFEPVAIGEPFPDVPGGLAVFDLEDDAAPDFAVGRAVGSDLWILRSSNAYARENVFMAGAGPTGLVAGDFDGDGHDDVAASLFLTDNVSVHFGKGTGQGFETPIPAAASDGPFALAAADLDGNGLGDFVVANHDALSLSAILQTSARSFDSRPAVPVQVGLPIGIAAGNLTDDALLDVVVGGELGLEVLQGDGQGNFASALFVPTAAEFEVVRVADLDGDQLSEVIGADRIGASLFILPGGIPGPNTAGGVVLLGPPRIFGVDAFPADFAVSELNGDGAPDLVAMSPLAGSLSLLLSREGTFLTGGVVKDSPLAQLRVHLAPNPLIDHATFRIAASSGLRRLAGLPMVLRIFDVSGRLVATPYEGTPGDGELAIHWDGRDARGLAVPRGMYFYRLEAEGAAPASGKLLRY